MPFSGDEPVLAAAAIYRNASSWMTTSVTVSFLASLLRTEQACADRAIDVQVGELRAEGARLHSSSRGQRDGLGWIAVEHVGGVRRRFGVPREDEQAEYVSRHRRATSCGVLRYQPLASAPSQSAMSVRGARAPGIPRAAGCPVDPGSRRTG
jgi:hypothetical protein